MSAMQFIKRNGVLVAGLALPILLMIVFMVSTLIPSYIANPPQYDLIFSSQDYSSNSQSPLTVNFFVQNGELKAQFIKNTNNSYNTWKKLFLYDAKAQKVRELPFTLPENFEKMKGGEVQTIIATKGMKLDPTLESPDGYQLSYKGYSNSGGLFGQLLWGGTYDNQACLRKGNVCVKLLGSDNRGYYYPGYNQFIGWVKP